MRIWPVLLDSQPTYIRASADQASLLLAPLGAGTILGRVCEWLEPVTRNAPIVVSSDARGQEYRDALAASSPGVRIACGAEELGEFLAGFELSDALLLLDPQCLPKRDLELSLFVREYSAESRVSHHLIAFEGAVAGTKERVSFDAAGQVRGILRYYEAATWPFVTGVAAMILPVACATDPDGLLFGSLSEVRRMLAARGVPARDIPVKGGAYDLTDAKGFLAANEAAVLAAAGGPDGSGSSVAPVLVGSGHVIGPRARLVGPVVVHSGARIDNDATILGPTMIGAGAHVEAGAVVAHGVVGPDTTVTSGTVVRDRLVSGPIQRMARPAISHLSSYEEKVARLTLQEDAGESTERLRAFPVKRAFDAVVAAVALVLLLPVLTVVAILVWLESRGPVFYGDEREGLGGRKFRCWKFRTMIVGAHAVQQQLKTLDQTDGPHFKVARDPRVTRVGRVLRATNLDELPQLFNVLLGEMSLVGPRPSPFRENQLCVPWRDARLSVRPGITGLWQVCRHDRSSGDFHQWIEYDLLYVQHLGLMLDLKILGATILTLSGKIPVPATWMISAAKLERAIRPEAA